MKPWDLESKMFTKVCKFRVFTRRLMFKILRDQARVLVVTNSLQDSSCWNNISSGY